MKIQGIGQEKSECRDGEGLCGEELWVRHAPAMKTTTTLFLMSAVGAGYSEDED